MKKFLSLLKVSIRSMLFTSTAVGVGKRKRAMSGLGVMAIMAALALYISGVYSFMLLEVLSPQGMEVLVFIYMGIAAVVGGLLYTTLAVKGVVFGGKDNDLLLSMPVRPALLMASRVTAVYLENLIFSFFMLVPAGVACIICSRGGVGTSLFFWVRVVIVALALPLLDTALSVVLGAASAFVSARFSRGKALWQNLFMGILLALVFWFSFRLNGMLARLAADAEGVKASLTWAAPFVWMGEGIFGDWGRLGAFVLCCAIPFVLMTVVLGRLYRRAVTAFQSHVVRGDYTLSAQSAAGQRKALLVKEARRFFGNAAYFWNAGLGLIMLLGVGAAALIKGEELRMILSMLGGTLPAAPLCGAAMGFCLSTCIITAPSVSLEGRYLWILREAPVGEGTLLRCKTGFQLLLSLPCTVIGAVCLSAAVRLPVWQGVVLTAGMLCFAVGQACFGMLVGLAFPKLDAANDTVVIKQSLASLLAMFVPMGAVAVAGGICWLVRGMGEGAMLLFPALFFLLTGGMCAWILEKKGPAMLKAL